MKRELYPANYKDPNPCVEMFGPGPRGKTCKTCAHLNRVEGLRSGLVLKCDQRTDMTLTPETDQKLKWQACGRYNEGENRTVFMK